MQHARIGVAFARLFFLFVFFLGLTTKKKNPHKIFARWHVAIAMSGKYS